MQINYPEDNSGTTRDRLLRLNVTLDHNDLGVCRRMAIMAILMGTLEHHLKDDDYSRVNSTVDGVSSSLKMLGVDIEEMLDAINMYEWLTSGHISE